MSETGIQSNSTISKDWLIVKEAIKDGISAEDLENLGLWNNSLVNIINATNTHELCSITGKASLFLVSCLKLTCAAENLCAKVEMDL